MKRRRILKYTLGLQTSSIHIGNGILTNLPKELKTICPGQQVIFLSDDFVYQLYGEDLRKGLEKQGYQVLIQIIPPGKGYKSWQMAEILMEESLKAGFKKEAIMLSLGGSVVSNLGGFVAAIYQGGLDYIQIPTTLSSQVDNAVGGEIFLDHPLGEKLIGICYLPLAVYGDTGTLSTLPREEFSQALSDIIQAWIIGDELFCEFLEKNINEIKNQDVEILEEFIYRSCQSKAWSIKENMM